MRKAIEFYEKALWIAQEIGDKRNERIWFGNLGNAYRDLGDIGEATEFYEKALRITREIGDRRGEAKLLNILGAVLEDANKYKEVLACFLLAKNIRSQIEDPELKTTELNLKNLEEKLGRKKFEMLLAEVAPGVEEIVRKMLE